MRPLFPKALLLFDRAEVITSAAWPEYLKWFNHHLVTPENQTAHYAGHQMRLLTNIEAALLSMNVRPPGFRSMRYYRRIDNLGTLLTCIGSLPPRSPDLIYCQHSIPRVLTFRRRLDRWLREHNITLPSSIYPQQA